MITPSADRRPIRALALALLLALLLPATPALAAPRPGSTDDLPRPQRGELSVMSLNVRFAGTTPPNSWPERRPVMQRLIREEWPDLIGTQEMLYQQLRDIVADQRDRYETITLGRDGGSRGEAMSVLYDPRRLDPLEYDHFWLSDTPDVIGSQTWAGCCPRMVTWVRFADRDTRREFYFVNTHFEAFDAGTRGLSAQLLARFLRGELDPAIDRTLPVVVTGDFNEALTPGGAVHDTLLAGAAAPLVDTWTSAARRGTPWGTFNNYGPPTAGAPRIDAILTSPGVPARATVVNTFSRDGQFPSDHLPVQTLLTIP